MGLFIAQERDWGARAAHLVIHPDGARQDPDPRLSGSRGSRNRGQGGRAASIPRYGVEEAWLGDGVPSSSQGSGLLYS